jgi:hypothetical protein
MAPRTSRRSCLGSARTVELRGHSVRICHIDDDPLDIRVVQRGVLSEFSLSRIRFRQMARAGELPGIRKSSV